MLIMSLVGSLFILFLDHSMHPIILSIYLISTGTITSIKTTLISQARLLKQHRLGSPATRFFIRKILLENESQKPQRESPASNASAGNFKNDEFSQSSLKVTKYSIFQDFSYLKFFHVFIIYDSAILCSKHALGLLLSE